MAAKRPSWRVIVCYVAGTVTALPMTAFLLTHRDAPWKAINASAFLFAVVMGFGLGYGPAKIILRLPLYREGYTPPSGGWFFRPWGLVLQMALLAWAAAFLALQKTTL